MLRINSAGETMDFVVKTAAESQLSLEGKKQQIDIQSEHSSSADHDYDTVLIWLLQTSTPFILVAPMHSQVSLE